MRSIVIAAALAAVSTQAAAAEDPEIGALKAQIQALSQRVAQLEAERARAAASAATSPSPPALGAVPPAAAPGPLAAQVPPAPLDRPLQPAGLGFQVSAGSGSSDVSVKASMRLSRPNLNGGLSGLATDDTLTLTASAPLDKNNPRTDLGTLDGFANSSTLKLRWTRFQARIVNGRRLRESAEIERAARDACRAKAEGDAARIKACATSAADYEFVKANLDAGTADRFVRMAFGGGPAFAFGVEGSIGYRKFNFVDAASFSKGSAQKVPWGLKAFVSLLPGLGLTSLTGALEYQDAYKDQDTAVICPAGTGGTVQCLSGPLGAPKNDRKLLGSLEFRHLFTLPDRAPLSSVGFSAQFTHDFRSGASGIDVPIYVVPDEKGNLLGGVRFGYRSDTDKLAVGVFVGTAFSIQSW